jgi:CheY-like chemotaxis protein
MSTLPLNILLIDDDAEDVEIFTNLLQSISSNVFFSVITDGETALKKLLAAECRPDYIFLDLNMPRMSGLDILTTLKQNDITGRFSIFLHSDCCDKGLIQQCLKLGARKFISKSADNWLLKSTLIELLLAQLVKENQSSITPEV